jgi:hypothetical protein
MSDSMFFGKAAPVLEPMKLMTSEWESTRLFDGRSTVTTPPGPAVVAFRVLSLLVARL